MTRRIPPLSIVKRHKTMLAEAKAVHASTTTVTVARPAPKFKTVLAPNANWPTGGK